jgi:hypothetical protein
LHDVSGIACRNYRPKPVLPTGDTVRLIPLGDGFYAYVDKDDYEWLSQWTWHAYGDGYAGRREKGKLIAMHREIMKAPKGMLVDHADGNRANNCRWNLRVCTYAQNQHNKRKQHGASSQFKGVTYSKRYDKWRAHCRAEGWPCHISYCDDEVEAARAYDRAAVERFGEFARPNFPEEWPPERRAEVHAMHQAEGVVRKKKKSTRKTRDAPRATKQRSRRTTGHGSRATARKKPRAKTQGPREKKRKTKAGGSARKKAGRPPTPG